jgi:hypothetical protein
MERKVVDQEEMKVTLTSQQLEQLWVLRQAGLLKE